MIISYKFGYSVYLVVIIVKRQETNRMYKHIIVVEEVRIV